MCGISGIINKDMSPVSVDAIKKINDLISHRGPDGDGFFSDLNFAFGHRRLAIIDTSDLGSQPMCYKERYWLTYNGEIYNYIELKEDLKQHGYLFTSGTDTEVILAAYDKWGIECLQRFNGMWSFALYDSAEEKILMSRDRFGVKPFYFLDRADNFVFGSEIKQLLSCIDGPVYANTRILIESMLTHVDNHTRETYFENIYSLDPGHYIMYDLRTNNYRIEKFYNLDRNEIIFNHELPENTNKFKELFRSAVSLRLRSDVTVGTCLSGGLDSSCISILGALENSKKTDERFIGIHAESSEKSTNESTFAQIVSEIGNIDLHRITPSIEDFTQNIDEVVYTQEEPFGSPSLFMSYNVFLKAKQLGCKVMLNGQGGDEVLLGYERYYASYLYSLNFREFWVEIFRQFKNSRLRFFDPIFFFIYFTNFRIRKQLLISRSFIKSGLKKKFDFAYLKKSVTSFKNVLELQKFEITSYQLPHLLRYEDRNSMRHSIETRLPFLDFRVVEFGISIKSQQKIFKGWTKYLLRKSFEDLLPSDIIWRKNKLGFNSPEKTWLDSHEQEMINEISASEILKKITDLDSLLNKYKTLNLRDKWMYYNVAVWERVFQVKLREDIL
jgi:asparagine synthase (glutamine-hydrolysing)